MQACEERHLPLGAAIHILTQQDSPKKIEYIKSLLHNPQQIEEFSATIQHSILKSCRSNRDLWIRYVAGYVQCNNQKLEKKIATSWPVEKKSSLQMQEYNTKFNFNDCCVLPCGAVIGGVSKEKKTITVPNHFWWTTPRKKETIETAFKLIHLSTGIILLQRNISIPGNFSVVYEDNPMRIEIIHDNSNVCHVVDVGSYYDALKNLANVSLKNYVEIVGYNQNRHCFQENDFVVV